MHIADHEEDFAVLAAYGNSHARFNVLNPRHHLRVFALLGKPRGGVEIKSGHKPPFPEQGPRQTVTPQRVERAVELAQGAKDVGVAIRRIAKNLRGRFTFNPFYAYPTPDEPLHKSEALNPSTDLHHYLWMATKFPRFSHCLDLAAGMLLVVRILGIDDHLSVERIWPWAPWDASTGERRNLDDPEAPWQGSLRHYKGLPAGQLVTFFAGHAYNFFEGVLKWTPKAGSPVLFAVGEDSLEFATTYGPKRDANATVFLQKSPSDREHGRFPLLVVVEATNEVVKPPFHFQRADQVQFMFEYDKTTFKPGDDKEPT
jgi:hypothetical protein